MIIHQDIRWPNVIQRLEDSLKWLIVDWDDAALALATAKSHFKRATHSLRLCYRYGTEVDIWDVGELIIRCQSIEYFVRVEGRGQVDARFK